MHPRIAVSAPLFSLFQFDEMLDRIEKQFSIWEMIAEGSCRLPQIKDRFKEVLENSNMKFTVHAPISDINLGSINPVILEAARNEVSDTIKIAGQLGISPVTIHIGFVSPLTILNKDKARAIARESMIILDKIALEYGVLVAVENMPKTRWAIFTEAEEIVKVIEGTEMALCFDIGHANISGNIEDFLPLKDRFKNMHIHDNNGNYDEHLVLGKGNMDLQKIVSDLRIPYQCNWVIECTELEQGIESRTILEEWLREE